MNSFAQLLGNSPEFHAVLRAAQIVAATDVTVLIQGESGTGKELLAQAMHRESRRADGPFVAINCAALPEGLVESELFGHRKGAFTGASDHHQGVIRSASGGTLFLDEVGELPLSIQAKLLRFIENGECQGIGESRPQKVDVRIITATNRDLQQESERGHFRQDLFYRLNVVPLQLPPLRERKGDVALLLKRLSRDLAERHQLPAVSFDRPALQALDSYHWPGNVRELRNLCERMVILFNGREIGIDNLPQEIRCQKGHSVGLFNLPDDGIRLEELEQQMIRQALSKSGGNRSRAARLLGLSRDTLLYRLKKYALNDL